MFKCIIREYVRVYTNHGMGRNANILIHNAYQVSSVKAMIEQSCITFTREYYAKTVETTEMLKERASNVVKYLSDGACIDLVLLDRKTGDKINSVLTFATIRTE